MYSAYLRLIGRYLSPNQITIIRAFFIIPAAFLWFSGDLVKEYIAIFIMILSWYGDHLDGAVARACDLESEMGKWLDPLIDKVVFYSTILIFIFEVNPIGIAIIFILDFVSTFVRSNKKRHVEGANWFGKFKLGSQVTASLMFALAEVFDNNGLLVLANNILYASIVLATISVGQRIKAYRWLPNIISIGNGLCGLVSMYYSYNDDFKVAINLIFVGMFLDILDGPLARKLKVESKIGMYFDDAADGTTFGFAVGFLILAYLNYSLTGCIIATLYIVTVIIRLTDYTKTKNNPKLAPPIGYFRGFPSPAGAGMVCIFVLFGVNQYLLMLIATLASALMVCFQCNWIHLGHVIPKILSKNPVLIAVVLVLAVTHFKIFLLLCLMAYIVSPIPRVLKRGN